MVRRLWARRKSGSSADAVSLRRRIGAPHLLRAEKSSLIVYASHFGNCAVKQNLKLVSKMLRDPRSRAFSACEILQVLPGCASVGSMLTCVSYFEMSIRKATGHERLDRRGPTCGEQERGHADDPQDRRHSRPDGQSGRAGRLDRRDRRPPRTVPGHGPPHGEGSARRGASAPRSGRRSAPHRASGLGTGAGRRDGDRGRARPSPDGRRRGSAHRAHRLSARPPRTGGACRT